MESLRHSEQFAKVTTALLVAQSTFPTVVKSTENSYFRSRYADLAAIWAAVRGPLNAHGICVVQAPAVAEKTVSVETVLLHTSGEWIASTITATAKDDGPQAIGSAITYLRRYALQSLVGVAAEDEDGNASEARRVNAEPHPGPIPSGYDDWLLSLEAVADEGTDALRRAWKASPADRRQYLTRTDPGQIDRLSARAKAAQTGGDHVA